MLSLHGHYTRLTTCSCYRVRNTEPMLSTHALTTWSLHASHYTLSLSHEEQGAHAFHSRSLYIITTRSLYMVTTRSLHGHYTLLTPCSYSMVVQQCTKKHADSPNETCLDLKLCNQSTKQHADSPNKACPDFGLCKQCTKKHADSTNKTCPDFPPCYCGNTEITQTKHT